jgi:hypothetical protein
MAVQGWRILSGEPGHVLGVACQVRRFGLAVLHAIRRPVSVLTGVSVTSVRARFSVPVTTIAASHTPRYT